MDYATYYESIVKPFFAPPAWVFGAAWGIIYPLMAIAGVLLIVAVVRRQAPRFLLWLFFANLIANLAFTPLQFSLGNTLLATLDILVVLGTLAYLEWHLWRHSKIIFWLLVPYLLWGTFATILQLSIIFLN